jgi:hypothetical protein
MTDGPVGPGGPICAEGSRKDNIRFRIRRPDDLPVGPIPPSDPSFPDAPVGPGGPVRERG